MADDKQTVIFPDEQDVMVDRSRITHKQSKRAIVLQIEVGRAQKAEDAERVAAILDELDQIVRSVVVSVPAGWLPAGVTLDTPDWLDQLSQDRYERLLTLSSAESAGQKKA